MTYTDTMNSIREAYEQNREIAESLYGNFEYYKKRGGCDHSSGTDIAHSGSVHHRNLCLPVLMEQTGDHKTGSIAPCCQKKHKNGYQDPLPIHVTDIRRNPGGV